MRPRPALLFTLCYGAGLATGLLRFGVRSGVVLPVLGRSPRAAAPCRLLRGRGCLAGSPERRAGLDRGSEHAAPHGCPPAGYDLPVRLDEPVMLTGGRVAGARRCAAGCHGTVSARWPARRAVAAGPTAGRGHAGFRAPGAGGRPGGTLVVSAAADPAPRPASGRRLGSATGSPVQPQSSTALAPPLVDALILGRRGGIDPDAEDAFAQSGLVHLLSISGFHVGLIARWVFLLAGCAGSRRERALVAGRRRQRRSTSRFWAGPRQPPAPRRWWCSSPLPVAPAAGPGRRAAGRDLSRRSC